MRLELWGVVGVSKNEIKREREREKGRLLDTVDAETRRREPEGICHAPRTASERRLNNGNLRLMT
jgi:hypothetical protein